MSPAIIYLAPPGEIVWLSIYVQVVTIWSQNSGVDPEILHKCPWPLSYSHGLGHFSSEHSRNLSELTLNLYSNQRVTCYCKSSFYHIFQFCANRNIVYLVEINFRMLVPTLLKHKFHILWLLIERSRGIVRGRIHFKAYFFLKLYPFFSKCLKCFKITYANVQLIFWNLRLRIWNVAVFCLCYMANCQQKLTNI